VVPRAEDKEEREREMDGQGINLGERRRKNNRSNVYKVAKIRVRRGPKLRG
jgi:hypothetical protein